MRLAGMMLPGNGCARDDFRAAGVGGAGCVAEPAACGQRVVDRDHRAGAVSDVGEIAGALRVGGNAVCVGLALAELETFVAEEEEGLVPLHRASDVSAVLILRECRTRNTSLVVEKRVGVENLVAEELIQAAVEGIGAGFCREIDRAAGQTAELGTQIVGLNPELLDRILRRNQRRQIVVGGIHRGAIDVGGALVGLPAPNLIITPGEGIGAGWSSSRLPTWDDARHQGHQPEHVASVQWRFEHFSRIDDLAQSGVLRLQQSRLRRHFDRLAYISNLHGHIDTDGALHLDGDRVA